MPIHLDVLKGPVGKTELEGIARTYGRHNRRFQSLEFCRTVFNENPYGYSHHAFAYDGERVIGHYSAIPMRLRDRGKRVFAARGEALFVEEAYRPRPVDVDGKQFPCGIALMDTVWSRAWADGVELIYLTTTPDLARILQRMRGFSCIPVPSAEYRCRISSVHPGGEADQPFRRRLQAVLRSVALRGFILTQRIRRRLFSATLALIRAPKVRVNAAEHLDEQLAALASAERDDRDDWGISWDVESLRWQMKLGRLEIHALEGSPERFAAVVRSTSPELVSNLKLLAWSLDPKSWRAGLAVLNAVLIRGEREAAESFAVDREALVRHAGGLRLGMRLLGSKLRVGEYQLYVKSDQERYRSREALAYDSFFSL
jgi:hypothetical protein